MPHIKIVFSFKYYRCLAYNFFKAMKAFIVFFIKIEPTPKTHKKGIKARLSAGFLLLTIKL